MDEFKMSAPTGGVTAAPSTRLEAGGAAGPEYVDVVLMGGPDTLPAEERSRRARPHVYKIKVPFYGGHEHFERVDPHQRPVVYRWTTRTRVAE